MHTERTQSFAALRMQGDIYHWATMALKPLETILHEMCRILLLLLRCKSSQASVSWVCSRVFSQLAVA